MLRWYYFQTDLSYPKDQSEAHLQHRIQFITVLLIYLSFILLELQYHNKNLFTEMKKMLKYLVNHFLRRKFKNKFSHYSQLLSFPHEMSAITELKRMRRLFNNLNLEKSVRTKDDISVYIHLAKKFIINVVLEIIFKNKKCLRQSLFWCFLEYWALKMSCRVTRVTPKKKYYLVMFEIIMMLSFDIIMLL